MQIKALALALANAQSNIVAPKKNRKVDFVNNKGQRVKYEYADLADVLDAIRIPLSKNNLSIAHVMTRDPRGFGLTTYLMHGDSGEYLETWYPLPDPETSDIRPQEFGGALTYARRYSVSSIVGIASEEDDDAQSAPTRPATRSIENKPTKKSEPPAKNPPKDSKGNQPASQESMERAMNFAIDRHIPESILHHVVKEGFGFSGPVPPQYVVDKMLEILILPDCTTEKLMAYAARLKNNRTAGKLSGEAK